MSVKDFNNCELTPINEQSVLLNIFLLDMLIR